jgi:hypothetical protein
MDVLDQLDGQQVPLVLSMRHAVHLNGVFAGRSRAYSGHSVPTKSGVDFVSLDKDFIRNC